MRPRRRFLLIAVPLAFLLFVAVGAPFLFLRGQNLKTRSALISAGMSREQIEEILGPPVVVLGRASGKGEALIWVDQLWQLNVRTDPDGRVESVEYVPSDSLYRRTLGRLLPPPQ
jgi:hypothetical protein